jgi:hypothetical protein
MWQGWTTSGGARDDVTAGHERRDAAPAALGARSRALERAEAGFAVVNACLTRDNSKTLNQTSKSPKTKVVDGNVTYNFYKWRHIF